jgi:hypothetical protein
MKDQSLKAVVDRRSDTKVNIIFPTMTVILEDQEGVTNERVALVVKAAQPKQVKSAVCLAR